jgi:hypothetical protein
VTLEGYDAYTYRGMTINPAQYLTDDPYLEVEVYFYAADALSSDGLTIEKKYGPYKTGSDGVFTADKLPANTLFTLEFNAFSQTYNGVEYYFDGLKRDGSGKNSIYAPGDWTANAPTTYKTHTGNFRATTTAEKAGIIALCAMPETSWGPVAHVYDI